MKLSKVRYHQKDTFITLRSDVSEEEFIVIIVKNHNVSVEHKGNMLIIREEK